MKDTFAAIPGDGVLFVTTCAEKRTWKQVFLQAFRFPERCPTIALRQAEGGSPFLSLLFLIKPPESGGGPFQIICKIGKKFAYNRKSYCSIGLAQASSTRPDFKNQPHMPSTRCAFQPLEAGLFWSIACTAGEWPDLEAENERARHDDKRRQRTCLPGCSKF